MIYWIISFLLPLSAITAMFIPVKSSSQSVFDQKSYAFLITPLLVGGAFGLTEIVVEFLAFKKDLNKAYLLYFVIFAVNFILFSLPTLIILTLRQKLC